MICFLFPKVYGELTELDLTSVGFNWYQELWGLEWLYIGNTQLSLTVEVIVTDSVIVQQRWNVDMFEDLACGPMNIGEFIGASVTECSKFKPCCEVDCRRCFPIHIESQARHTLTNSVTEGNSTLPT